MDLDSRRTLEEHHHRNLEPDGESPSEESQENKYKRGNVTLEINTQTTERIENGNVTANLTTVEPVDNDQMQSDEPPRVLIDPVVQERQLSKMASEIELLRSQIEQLAQQNRMLLNQQKFLNKSELQTERDD